MEKAEKVHPAHPEVRVVSLSVGTHTITASVTDSQGDSDSDDISLTVTELVGDVNGDGKLDVADLFLLQEHLSGLNSLSGSQAQRADLYPLGGDSELTSSDLIRLQQLLTTP